MRKHLFPSLLALLLAATPFFAAVTKYDIDAAHSNIGFSIPIAGGLSNVRGKFSDFAVTIVYDDKDVTKSSVEA
ncbi:MAG TPA: YceI family protein, partial [Pyrinomonadaceae bacterium]|nr:YceI family protein [Pyrinomonadaceae bacterium]